MSPSNASSAAPLAITPVAGVPVQISSSWGASHQQQQRNVDVGGGLISLVAHALQLCAHAARCSVQDLQTTPWAWRTEPTNHNNKKSDRKDEAEELDDTKPPSSSWTYVQHALLYHRQHVPTTRRAALDDLDQWLNHWDEGNHPTSNPLPPYLLGRISLYFVASRELSQDELTNPRVPEDEEEEEEEDLSTAEDDDDEEMNGSPKKKVGAKASPAVAPPPEVLSSTFWRRFGAGGGAGNTSNPVVLLYHAVVEYRSLPATGSPWAVQAEAWSMMTWGQGSPLDEELKWAALAGLSDPQSKYLLEIDSVRGKRYQFDWIPATSPPPLIQYDDEDEDDDDDDEFDHNSSQWAQCLGVRVSDQPESSSSLSTEVSLVPSNSTWAKTRMQFRLDAKTAPRDFFGAASFFQQTSPTVALYRVSKLLQGHFLPLNPHPPTLIRAIPSGHALILTPIKADAGRPLGQVYWQGRFWKNWNKNSGGDGEDEDEVDDVWNHAPALFGMNLNSPFPLKGGGGPTATMTTPLLQPPPRPSVGGDSPKRRTSVTIVDVPSTFTSPTTLLKQAYAVMWQELLIDARYERWDLAGKLLNRLIYDIDAVEDDDEENLDDGMEESNQNGGQLDKNTSLKIWQQRPPPSANLDCLESIVLQSNLFDPVGIAAKALATHFATRYGAEAFPCLSHEVGWVQQELPKRGPIVIVPQRALNVLRRGGYFDVARTKQDMVQPQELVKDPPAPDQREKVIRLACNWLDQAEGNAGYRILHQAQPWRELVVVVPSPQFDQPICQFDATLQVFQVREDFFLTADWSSRLGTTVQIDDQDATAAYLLGMYLAQVHPNGTDVLARYLLQNARLSNISATAEPMVSD